MATYDMEYTEDVYKNINSGILCRIENNNIKIHTRDNVMDGYMIVFIDGNRVAIEKGLFDLNYVLHEPAEKIDKGL